MNTTAQRKRACSFLCMCLLYASHPVSAWACAIVTPEEGARRQQAYIEQGKAEASALRNEADQVFVGTLSQLTPIRETIRQGSGGDVVLHTYQARFDAVENIKGQYSEDEALAFTVNRNRVYVGCGPLPFRSSLPQENGTGERYLVYARAGTIFRTNPVSDNTQALTGRDEAQHLRAAPR